MDQPKIDLWYEFASPYSYIAAAIGDEIAARRGVQFEWRPLLLGPIFAAQGWNDSPFRLYPVKGRYMWSDMARLCRHYGIAWRQPTQMPRNGLLAARVATAYADARWVKPFVRAVFESNFVLDRDIGDVAVIARLLADVGVDAQSVLQRATDPETKAALRRSNDVAVRLGIFGAPTFVVGSEIFWGTDRLQMAIDHALDLQAASRAA